jgi:hypothetical protein
MSVTAQFKDSQRPNLDSGWRRSRKALFHCAGTHEAIHTHPADGQEVRSPAWWITNNYVISTRMQRNCTASCKDCSYHACLIIMLGLLQLCSTVPIAPANYKWPSNTVVVPVASKPVSFLFQAFRCAEQFDVIVVVVWQLCQRISKDNNSEPCGTLQTLYFVGRLYVCVFCRQNVFVCSLWYSKQPSLMYTAFTKWPL